jgi:hypothetical protein
MLTSENKLIKEGRHVGLDFYDLLIEALIERALSPTAKIHQYPYSWGAGSVL